MKYLFILGRNPELSKLELKEFFKGKIKSSEEKDTALILDLEYLEKDSLKKLGGIIRIGKILLETSEKNLEKDLEKIEIYSEKSNKLTYTLWEYSSYSEELKEYLKNRLKSEKIKANYKGLNREIKMQENFLRIPSSKTLNKEYFLFSSKDKEYFGEITEFPNSEEIEKRDIEKPVRREELAISPRLSKIMINLANLKEGETLIDPFCGIGVILSEALLQKIKVIGIDKDKSAIQGAEKNLKWFKFKKDNYLLFNSDSTKIKIPKGDSIVTEPDLGETFKKIPTKEKAKKIIKEFEALIEKTINNLKENTENRIVFTSPYIRIGKKRISCDIEKICKNTRTKLIFPGIPEYRENQIVGRKIYVLEKN